MKKKIIYDKLVRDRIPEILIKKGIALTIHTAEEAEYEERLIEKLKEEVAEFAKDKNEEELADIFEVIYAIVSRADFSMERIEELRMKKKEERGGFANKIVLEQTTE